MTATWVHRPKPGSAQKANVVWEQANNLPSMTCDTERWTVSWLQAGVRREEEYAHADWGFFRGAVQAHSCHLREHTRAVLLAGRAYPPPSDALGFVASEPSDAAGLVASEPSDAAGPVGSEL